MKKIFSVLPFLVFLSSIILIQSCSEDKLTETENHAPKIQSVSANPSTVATNGNTTLTCVATDEDGDNLSTIWSAQSGSFPNGNTGSSVTWQAPSTADSYTIAVTVSDGKATDEGSVNVNVQEAGTGPQAPILSLPQNGVTGVSLTPALEWNESNGALSYALQVSTDNGFTSYLYNQSGLTATSQQINGLNNSTTYYWRVNASNSYGTSGWSDVWSFTTAAGGTAPEIPILSSPQNGATGVIVPATLEWNASNGATSYSFQVSTDISFTSFVYDLSGLTVTSQQINGLDNATIYYWRVSASNSYGTSGWSDVWSFTTAIVACQGIVNITYEGKVYKTVEIETQCWLKENLDVGSMIPGSQNQTNNGIIEKYCYNDDPNNCNSYGGLYQWDEVMHYESNEGAQGICPPGWHIPTLAEFQILAGAVNWDGNSLKEIGQGTGGGAGTNTSGFSALLAGGRAYNGYFYYLSYYAYFWSSTEYDATFANYVNLFSGDSNINFNFLNKVYGYSVRCLKD
jgi:uncharacterized protein (TIGR02145 family)